MENKVQKLLQRFSAVEEELGNPDVFDDQKRYRELTQDHSYLTRIKQAWEEIVDLRKQNEENRQLLSNEQDEELIELLTEETEALTLQISEAESALKNLLVPPDPNDHRNVIMEIRAGTGGDEAALFVGDCVRMYSFFADKQKWEYELLSCTRSDLGGFREYIMVLSGQNVHRYLQYEGGTHRVQRVPETETQGRVHTSAITVAILLEPDEKEEIEIDEKELRVDTMRASGAGGQHVNTTDSAVRLTHLPTGIAVYCQEEKSQHKNKDKAMRLLKAKIVEIERQKEEQSVSDKRNQQVGTGDRSGRIRTYNFSQNRVTDHRINLTLYNLDHVINGELESVVEPLVAHFYQKKMES